MFGHKAAVKHTLLESEKPKYLGTDNGKINLELMTKLYMVITHNLNKARKAKMEIRIRKHQRSQRN